METVRQKDWVYMSNPNEMDKMASGARSKRMFSTHRIICLSHCNEVREGMKQDRLKGFAYARNQTHNFRLLITLIPHPSHPDPVYKSPTAQSSAPARLSAACVYERPLLSHVDVCKKI